MRAAAPRVRVRVRVRVGVRVRVRAQQHLHTVVVAMPLNLLVQHYLKEGISAASVCGCAERDLCSRWGAQERENLMDPTLRAAQLQGDVASAHVGRGGLGNTPLVNSAQHRRR